LQRRALCPPRITTPISGPSARRGQPGSGVRAHEQGSIWFAPGGTLIFVWELSVGIYMTVKGFKPSPITATR
jgi:hypothetical protein